MKSLLKFFPIPLSEISNQNQFNSIDHYSLTLEIWHQNICITSLTFFTWSNFGAAY